MGEAATEPGAMRERILGEAARRFVASGYHGISMREIAESIGVSKASLYYHFQDKESLFLAILEQSLEGVDALFDPVPGGDVRARIAAVMDGLLTWPSEQRAVIRLATQEVAHLGEESRRSFMSAYRGRFVGRIEAILREGMAAGELRRVDPAQATWLLLGLMYPLTAPSLEGGSARARRAEALMLEIFFDGLAVHPAAGRDATSGEGG